MSLKKNIIFFISFVIYLSYFFGYYFDENSIGSGGYNGDLSWMWNNFDIFKNNNVFDAIKNEKFFGNRTPLLYIINIFFNPFIDNIDNYRFSIFFFSLLGPLIFYYCLKEKFKNTDKELLFLLSSLLLLSPFYRTTAYWGMEINYGIITTLSSIYFLNKIIINKTLIKKKNIFLLIFFSSITVYFDQKLVLIPLISVVVLLTRVKSINILFFIIVFYIILALPFIYLMYIWEGIVPKWTQIRNPNTITNIDRISNLYFYNLGYASTLICFYLFPLVFFKKKIIEEIKNFLNNNTNYLFIIIPVIYLYFLITNYDFKFYTIDNYWIGFGIIHKLSKILFDKLLFQEIFTYISFVISWFLIIFLSEKKIINLFILGYFFFISLFLWPLMQEYFDPLFIISLLLFKTKITIKHNRLLFLTIYFTIFLIGSNIYYLGKL